MPRKNGNKPMSKEMAKSGMHKMQNGMMKDSEMKKKMGKKKSGNLNNLKKAMMG